ncbi:Innexin [Dirofilaria immitis]|nr:Innexin [Dirofilaria immitis]
MVSGGYRVGMHLITSALRLLEPRVDDDFVDRLHYLYTSTMFFLFSIIVSAKQYGHPIECFVPAQFTKAMEQYTENYCWVQNTYWVPFQDLIPHRLDDREHRQIGYYQWVPFALAISAIMFHMPSTIWRILSTQSGLNMSLVIQLASQDQNVDPLIRDHSVEVLTRHIDDALKYQRDYGSRNKSVYLFAVLKLGKIYGAYVSVVYLFVKSLHLCNVILQFIMLNNFLETSNYPFFGGHVLYDLIMGREWHDSGRFPRVTLCDFEIRVLEWRHAFVTKFLECESNQTHRFVHHFLRPDGVLILHEKSQENRLFNGSISTEEKLTLDESDEMIASHGGNIVCARLTESLWMKFLQRSGKLTVFDVEKAVCSEKRSGKNGNKHVDEGNWREPTLPPPMPLLPTSTQFV